MFYSSSIRQIHQALSRQNAVYLGALQAEPTPGCVYTTRSTFIHRSESPPVSPTGDIENHLVSEARTAKRLSYNKVDEFAAANAKQLCL